MAVALIRHSLVRFKLLCPAVLTAVVLQTQVAGASTEFPEEIQATLSLECPPTCLLCHKTMAGGPGNLNSYGDHVLGQRIIQAGPAVVYAPEGPASMDDADMDGKTDLSEIIANTDPGSEEDLPIRSCAIYGCGAAQMAPGSTPRTPVGALVLACGVAAFLLRQVRV